VLIHYFPSKFIIVLKVVNKIVVQITQLFRNQDQK